MYDNFNIWTFLAGLPLGLLIAGAVWLLTRRKLKKERAFDERYRTIHRHARSISWMATTAAVLAAWMIVLIVQGPKLAFFLLTGIWVVHMLSYMIGAAVASSQN
ncbi:MULTISPECIES: LPXTG cell wall anchor domain-containing protein [Sporosarcina]|uniref:LPXTG cell wall anchor domain-containing protein n=1 Tax=Sporosarcina TaxID=1569 RepID=UPI000591560A|nr:MULTISPECIES: LPXTG cell wall anchor domain-containing protein [Sporosarcina]WJY27697.1 LPXTG cell wall anchor domain-containing protein [Sporosarcina sp. 0.2-SM1T-5]